MNDNHKIIEILPNLRPGYDTLCMEGRQFTEPHELTQLDTTFMHPERGDMPIQIDKQVLREQGSLCVGDVVLREALREQEISVQTWTEAKDLLDYYLGPENDDLVWGFSGFATGGINPATNEPYSYQSEADALHVLYEYLISTNQDPDLVFDGGVSEGFLALNSIVASSAYIPTLGFLPKQGLASAGIRSNMIVVGETYEDREKAVATADVLVCMGGRGAGKGGTEREAVHAILGGAGVLLVDNPKYGEVSLPKSFRRNPILRKGYDDGQLVLCEAIDDLPARVEDLLRLDLRLSRRKRLHVLTDFMR